MGKHISRENSGELAVLSSGERGPIGRLPAVKHLSDPAHFSWYCEIAYPHLPHVVVHVLAEAVEQRLAELASGRGVSLQTSKHQNRMQDDHFEAAHYRIRHAIGLIERGAARLRHDGAIERGDVGEFVGGKEAQHLELWIDAGLELAKHLEHDLIADDQ